ncbi:hypothetical protein PINS_up020946 [Pythium insidiosum]|nr:hypothetical protein PINS_up020946 [Pythium insidiosum]
METETVEVKKNERKTVDHDAIARAIDAELGLDSSDDDEDDSSSNSSSSNSSSCSESGEREVESTVVNAMDKKEPQAAEDVISAAIDAELASSSDEDVDAEDPLAMLHGAAPPMALAMPAGLLEPPVGVLEDLKTLKDTENAVAATQELMDSVSAAIDAELELSDEEVEGEGKEDEEKQTTAEAAEPETSLTVNRIQDI